MCAIGKVIEVHIFVVKSRPSLLQNLKKIFDQIRKLPVMWYPTSITVKVGLV